MPHPDILGYGMRDYGPRVGFWRLLEVFDRYQIKCTMSLNLACYAHFPEIKEACESRGWDAMCHGIYNSEYNSHLPLEQEREAIQRSCELFRNLAGRELTGWYSPGGEASMNTADLIAEAGLTYYADWMHDDQPFPMRVKSGRLITLPYSMDLNDSRSLRECPFEAAEFVDGAIDQFDRLYAESKSTALVMCLPLHPYIMGQPHRVGHLDRLFDYILSHDGVWQATGLDIATWYIENHLAEVEAHLASRQSLMAKLR